MLVDAEIPVAHISDPRSIAGLVRAYASIHGPDYQFAVRRWQGETVLPFYGAATAWRFIIEAEEAALRLRRGNVVRGPSSSGPYEIPATGHARVTEDHDEPLWPGDAVIANAEHGVSVVTGKGTYFEIISAPSPYNAPKASFLRNLDDHPGGCAAYDRAFRRETLPPEKPVSDDPDRVGTNRVNEHTLDMRIDRDPPPTKHHHGTVTGAKGRAWNHSETAIVLPRPAYGLPEVNGSEEGWAIIYRNPRERGTSDSFRVPVRPGSIVVTPSTGDAVYGHCFENAFAMLVAVPGFVAPYKLIG